MVEKKGQVSTYIVIGVVILFFILISVYFYNRAVVQGTDSVNVDKISDSVPTEFLPFKRYVETCANDVLVQALKRAGASGGEIYSRDLGRTYNLYNPAESEGIELFMGGDLVVPYWTYLSGDADCANGCQKVYQISPLTGDYEASIETQVETYVKRNFKDCVKARTGLASDSGITYKEVGTVDANVTFGEMDVVLVINYPVEIKTENTKLNVSKFATKVNLPFKKYYESALYLSQITDETQLFEKATLRWISIYSGMNNDKLPPKAGMNLDYVSTLTWVTQDVKTKLQDIVRSNVRLFTVNDSKNYHPYKTDAYFKNVYNNYIIPSNGDFSDFNVDFSFDTSEMYLKINDNKEVLRPESSSMDWFPFLGVNVVRNLYSVTYPVKVTISNPDALNGEGFEFSFATEVNIKDNYMVNGSYKDTINYSAFEGQTGSTKTMMCDIFNSKNVSFTLSDGENASPLSGVGMNFVCGKETCPIGKTGDDGKFSGPLPICAGGRVQFAKGNYEQIFLKVDPSLSKAQDFGNIFVEPYRIKNLTVKKYNYNKLVDENRWYLADSPVNVANDEKIIVQLERVSVAPTPEFIERSDFAAYGVVQNGEVSSIRILPGEYVGTILGVHMSPIKFLPKESCTKTLFSNTCYSIPNETMTMDSLANGGAYMNDNTTHIFINKDNLDSKKMIEFYMFSVNIPGIPESSRIIEDLGALSMVANLSVDKPGLLGPTYR